MKSTKRIDAAGYEIWELPNGKRHREDGPAVISSKGSEGWYINGRLHREDGPAVTLPSGKVHWYLDYTRYLFDEYCDELRRNYGKTDEDIMLLRMRYV